MDPDVALAAARKACELVEIIDEELDPEALIAAVALALGYYQTLDEWITKGGFLPKEWASTVGALPSV